MATVPGKPEPLSDELLVSDLSLHDKVAGLTNGLADSSQKSDAVHLSGLLSADGGVGLTGTLPEKQASAEMNYEESLKKGDKVLEIGQKVLNAAFAPAHSPAVPAPVLPIQPAPAVPAPVLPLQPAPVAEHLQMERLDPVSKREAKKASHKANKERRIKPLPPTSEQKEAEKRRLEERKQERYAIGLARVAEKHAAKSAKTAAEKEDKRRRKLARAARRANGAPAAPAPPVPPVPPVPAPPAALDTDFIGGMFDEPLEAAK